MASFHVSLIISGYVIYFDYFFALACSIYSISASNERDTYITEQNVFMT